MKHKSVLTVPRESVVLSFLALLSVLLLPGQWIAFALPLVSVHSAAARFLIGVALSPLLVVAEFFLLRVLGVSFDVTAWTIAFANLPALYLIYRRGPKLAWPSRRELLAAGLVTLVPLVLLAYFYWDIQNRANIGHTWLHADTVYELAKGALHPEEAMVAGLPIGYPWFGHIYQAVASLLLDQSPVFNYHWLNIVSFVVTLGFAYFLMGAFPTSLAIRVVALLWLCFGINPVGYALQGILPPSITKMLLFGDLRYTPWMRKFFQISQLPLGLAALAGLIALVVRHPNVLTRWDGLLVTGLLVAAVGLLYPILILPTGIVVGGLLLRLWLDACREGRPFPGGNLARTGGVALLAVVPSFFYLQFIDEFRVLKTGMELASLRYITKKAIEFLMVTSPWLIGIVIGGRRALRLNPGATATLAFVGLANGLLYILAHLPHFRNEYKFMYVAGLGLFPFVAIGLEGLTRELKPTRKFALHAILLTALVFSAAYAVDKDMAKSRLPTLRTEGFELRLAPGEPEAELFDVLRTKTPKKAVLVLSQAELHWPTLTQRSLYIPPAYRQVVQGINYPYGPLLVGNRGYGSRLVESRRNNLMHLFDAASEYERREALNQLLAIGRPLLIVIDRHRHVALEAFLTSYGEQSRFIFETPEVVVWLVEVARPSGVNQGD